MANGTPGNDYLANSDTENYGFDGNDTIIFVGGLQAPSSTHADGGDGNDYIEISKNVTVAADVVGGFGDDWISSGNLSDDLFGGGGNDFIAGGTQLSQPGKFSLDNDELWGEAGIDGLYGFAGNDVIHGGSEDDRAIVITIGVGHDGKALTYTGGLYGDAGNDKLYGESGNDDLFGGSGNDLLDGGDGVKNRLFGGIGDDTFYFNEEIDEVFEDPGAGYDTLIVRWSKVNHLVYELPAGLEIEELQFAYETGTLRSLAGNEFNQVLRGNGSDNSLWGEGGADTAYGMDGNDFLSGEGGADQLYGGKGDDNYIIGNDKYIAGDAAAAVFEAAGEGSDELTTYVSYTLTAGAEIEEFRSAFPAGTHAIELTGNALHQSITGNAGNNTLHDGGVGAADMLTGLGGNDTYRVFNAGDTIVESASQGAHDVVMAAVDYVLAAGVYIERLATNGTAGTSAIDLTGNERHQEVIGNSGANKLDGKAGSDVIKGLGGNDTLAGGTGTDVFVFNSTLSDSTNVDTITDFSVAADTIQLDNAFFTALTTTGALAASAFKDIADGPKDASDRVIYNSDTGGLYYDADGSGGVYGNVKFAVIATQALLTGADFVVI